VPTAGGHCFYKLYIYVYGINKIHGDIKAQIAALSPCSCILMT